MDLFIRAAASSAYISAEETALVLFNSIVEKMGEEPKAEEILPLFAKCMLAVKNPESTLNTLQDYKINHD